MAEESKKGIIFLDRDGVLLKPIRVGHLRERAAVKLSEYEVVEGSVQVVASLGLEFKIFVVSNQPDYSRGLSQLTNLEEINSQIYVDFPSIEKIYNCLHSTEMSCGCRKPKAGLLEQALKEFHISNPDNMWMVGDRWVDVAAGKAMGCNTVLIEREISWRRSGILEAPKDLVADFTVKNFFEVQQIVSRHRN